MGDDQRRLLELLLDLQHLVAEQEPGLLVERGERLVHQQDLRLRGERARHRHPLAHAARELGRIAPLEPVETDQMDEMARLLVARRLAHARDLEWERDVVDHGAPGKRRLLLEHHADGLVRAGHRFARDRHPPVVAVGEAADDVEKRRLAAPGGADHAEELARRDGQRNVVDGSEDAVWRLEPLDDVLHDEDGICRTSPGGNRIAAL